MKIILEFPGDTAEEAMSSVRAFAEAWANIYANAALPPIRTPESHHAWLDAQQEAERFLKEVDALEQREDLKPEPKPAQTKPPNGVRRKQVEAAFRAMIDKYKVGPDDGPATQAGRAVLKHIGATSVPAIPEAKLVECLALLNISDCYPTAEAFIERLQSHEAAA